MKPYLQTIAIECWEHIGRLGTNAPYICLYRSDTDSVAPLLTAIEELEADEAPSRRSITFAKNERQRQCRLMRFRLDAECEELRQFRVSVDGTTALIEMTPSGLQILREAVEKWRDGLEDFGISSRSHRSDMGSRDLESGEIWFWGPGYLGP